MSNEIASSMTALGFRLDRSAPLSSMCREVGLAAVAAELELRANELELDAAVAVERGAAALYLAGFGPKKAARAPHVRTGKPTGRKVRPPSAKAGRRSRPRAGTRG